MTHDFVPLKLKAPKPTFLEVFMVNNLVFRWPRPLFFMVGRGLMVVTSVPIGSMGLVGLNAYSSG